MLLQLRTIQVPYTLTMILNNWMDWERQILTLERNDLRN
jgi:hypothetical protein